MDSLSKHFSFLSGYVEDRNTLRFIAQADQLSEANEPNSTIMKKTINPPGRQDFHLDWYATRLCVISHPKRMLVLMGVDGRMLHVSEDGPQNLRISEDTTTLGVLRNLRVIADSIFVVGMGRQVYRLTGATTWNRADSGVLQDLDSTSICGFNSIDGKDQYNLIAVGFNGEIWEYRDNNWFQVDSPTNVILNCVRVTNQGRVLACGKKGVLLERKSGIWTQINHESTADELWCIEEFGDCLYIASSDSLYLLEADQLSRVSVGLENVDTYGHLHANDGVLLSVGRKHIVFTLNGQEWQNLDN